MLLPLLYFANPIIILATSVFGSLANAPLWLLLRAVNLYLERQHVTATAFLVAIIAACFDASYAVLGIALTGTWEYTALIYTALQVAGYAVAGIHNNPLAQQQQHHYASMALPSISLSVMWYTHVQLYLY